MTPKERRERLFKKSRPNVRPLESKDMGWLWAAYKAGSFHLAEGMTPQEFAEEMQLALNGTPHYLVEDENKKFRSGKGPIALIAVPTDGVKIEPAVAIFKWATPKNVLRGFVSFFQWVKSWEVAECEVKVPPKDRKLLKKVTSYGVLYPRRVDVVYGVSGKKK